MCEVRQHSPLATRQLPFLFRWKILPIWKWNNRNTLTRLFFSAAFTVRLLTGRFIGDYDGTLGEPFWKWLYQPGHNDSKCNCQPLKFSATNLALKGKLEESTGNIWTIHNKQRTCLSELPRDIIIILEVPWGRSVGGPCSSTKLEINKYPGRNRDHWQLWTLSFGPAWALQVVSRKQPTTSPASAANVWRSRPKGIAQ